MFQGKPRCRQTRALTVQETGCSVSGVSEQGTSQVPSRSLLRSMHAKQHMYTTTPPPLLLLSTPRPCQPHEDECTYFFEHLLCACNSLLHPVLLSTLTHLSRLSLTCSIPTSQVGGCFPVTDRRNTHSPGKDSASVQGDRGHSRAIDL